MDQEKETDNPDYNFELAEEEQTDEPADEAGSVDDFIRELEAKEKDLHITSETTFIEIASEFEEDEVPDLIREELAPKAEKPAKPAAPPKIDPAIIVRKLEADMSALRSENTSLRNETDTLLKKIKEFKDERAELFKNAERRLKDFESYRARNEREREETFDRLLSNLATQMLPALDNLDRALQFVGETTSEKQSEFDQFFDGIVLVNQQVNEVLAGMGIMPIETVGQRFDPHFHEAVAVETTEEHEPNTITGELLRGFRIGDKVVRHSMVKVAQAPTKPKVEEPAADVERPTAEELSEELEKVFGEFDPRDVADAAEQGSAGETDAAEDENEEAQETGFAIERNGEVESPKKAAKAEKGDEGTGK